jgi:thioredoxin-like negative regulator of GroEL
MSAGAEQKQLSPVEARDTAPKPALVFFYSSTSGPCRHVEGFIAQVLQRHRNHDTFTLHRIDHDARPDLASRFGISGPPALVVVDNKRVRARLEQPRGCVEIQTLLAPWLR